MSIIGDLAVKVGADITDFSKGMKSAGSMLDGFRDNLDSGAKALASYSAAAAATGAAIASAMVVNSSAAAKELQNLSAVANASTSDFQKMAFGAKTVGIEQEKLADILKDTKDRVGDFLTTGGGPMADFFEQIAPKVGVTAEQFRNLSGPQSLQLFVDSLQKANLSQAEMTFYMEAMASDATALIPLLRDGGAAMAEQAKRAEELGLVLSDIQVEQLANTGRQIERMTGVVGAFSDQFSAQLSPAITMAMDELEKFIIEMGGMDSVAETAFNAVITGAGFVMDAIEGVRRVVVIAADVMVAAFAGFLSNVTTGLDFVADGVQRVADITGVELPASVQTAINSIKDFHATNEQVQKEALQNIQDTLNAPMPSEGLKQFVADAKEAANEAAKVAVEARTAAAASVGGGGEVEADPNKELERLRELGMSKQELLREQLIGELEILKEAQAMKQISQDEAFALSEQSHARYNQAIADIEAESAEKRRRIEEQLAASRKAATGKMFSDLTSLMNSGSRKMFEIGKAAAISQTVIDTFAGAQKAFSALAGIPIVGPALGAAAAAAAIAAGTARIQSIRSQSFGGSATGGAGGGAISNTQAVNANAAPVASGGGGGDRNLFVRGIGANDLFTGSQLIDIINQAQEDGARLRIS